MNKGDLIDKIAGDAQVFKSSSRGRFEFVSRWDHVHVKERGSSRFGRLRNVLQFSEKGKDREEPPDGCSAEDCGQESGKIHSGSRVEEGCKERQVGFIIRIAYIQESFRPLSGPPLPVGKFLPGLIKPCRSSVRKIPGQILFSGLCTDTLP